MEMFRISTIDIANGDFIIEEQFTFVEGIVT